MNQLLSVIDWKTTSAQKLFNIHRALSHLYPLKTNWKGQLIKLRDISLEAENRKPIPDSNLDNVSSQKSALDFLLNAPSEKKITNLSAVRDSGYCIFDYENKLLKVICADGNKIIINKLQVTNRVITGIDFYNGYMRRVNRKEWKFENALDSLIK